MTRIFVRPSTYFAALIVLLSAAAPARAQRILGLDISAHQGVLSQDDWDDFYEIDNRKFVILRSSRGGTTGQDNRQGGSFPGGNTTYRLSQRYDDPYFIQNVDRATVAGLFVGTYHRSRADVLATTPNSANIGGTAGADNTGTDDANHFIQMAGPFMRPGYLPPVLDFEDGISERTDVAMAQFALDFGNRIYEVMKIRPAIYINGNYAQNVLAGGTAAQRNELAQPATNPPSFLSPTFPTLWVARWPGGSGGHYPASSDVQVDQPKDTFTNIYGPWDDYGALHPWAFWQYATGPSLQSYGGNIDQNIAAGDIEFVKDQLIPAVWWNNSSGDWSTLLNWNSGQPVVTPPFPLAGNITPTATSPLPTPRLPGQAVVNANGPLPTTGLNDTVILERPDANITVTVSTGSHNIRKLYMRESLNITGGSLTINYDPNYVSDTVNFPNSLRSGTLSAQFSGAVSMSGGSLSVNTLQVDATRTFTLSGGTLTMNKINLMPHASTPAKIVLSGNVTINPLANAAAVVGNGTGTGNTGRFDLGGANRTITVGNGSAAIDLAINVPVSNGGLTKAGAGTLSLAGANDYTGDTSVLAGTLRLNSALLPNAADVKLQTGGLLELNFTSAADVVDQLIINGVSMPTGTWGSPTSSAARKSSLISGTGTLQVNTFVASADFNLDGRVDDADLNAWQLSLGVTPAPGTSFEALHAMGDANLDGVIDSGDFLLWQQQYNPAPPAADAVPEPAAAMLLPAAAAALWRLRRRAL